MSEAAIAYLDELIADCRKRLREAQNLVFQIEGELSGYTKARSELKIRLRTQHAEMRSADRRRDFSENWKQILRFIASNELATIDDIEGFASIRKFDLQRGAIRSQLHLYSQRGLVERVGTAQYQLTAAGKEIVKNFD